MKSNTTRLVATALVILVGTWFAGWWAVPVIGLIAGLLLTPAWAVGLAAGLAWLLLLIGDMFGEQFGRLSSLLGGVMGLPAVAIIGLTLLFPMILGWSAAATGTALRAIRRTDDPSRHMSRAP